MRETGFRTRPYYPFGSIRQTMARCDICSRTRMSGNNVSHSKRRTRRRWGTNVHKATIGIDGRRKQVKMCTRCLRTHYKTRARA